MTTLQVLAVDDERGMCEGIARVLNNFTTHIQEVDQDVSFNVQMTYTGEDAISILKKGMPDILLLDYKLPGASGLDVLKSVTEMHGDVLTIMITAYASIETAIAATKQGAYDFLPKPFTPADLRHTVRKAATRMLLARHARQLEDEKRRVRFEFIRVLGHELKAPIAAVTGYLDIMKDHVMGEDITKYDHVVERSLVRLEQMRKMIVDLLDLTRIESGEKARDLKLVDLTAAARQAIELVEQGAKARGITLVLKAPEKMEIAADKMEVDMMLNNLVSNAVKYNRENGQVSISLSNSAGFTVIEVSDTGIGMTKEEQVRLFEEFVRIRNKDTRDILGSGLGLSILKRLAGLYKGRIEVESEPGRGSTFRLFLQTGNKRDEQP